MTKVFWTYYIKRFLNNELRQSAVKCIDCQMAVKQRCQLY